MSLEQPNSRPFVTTLPMVLLRAREALMEPVRVVLRAHDLTDQQWRVIRVLGSAGAMEMTELARAALMHRPNLTRLVRSLAERGYISRRPHPQDRRSQVVAVSNAGRAIIAEVQPLLAAKGMEVRDAYGAEKLERLRGMLLELIETAGSVSG
jgi:homoprotocatechuate degradation regulator HpaR